MTIRSPSNNLPNWDTAILVTIQIVMETHLCSKSQNMNTHQQGKVYEVNKNHVRFILIHELNIGTRYKRRSSGSLKNTKKQKIKFKKLGQKRLIERHSIAFLWIRLVYIMGYYPCDRLSPHLSSDLLLVFRWFSLDMEMSRSFHTCPIS